MGLKVPNIFQINNDHLALKACHYVHWYWNASVFRISGCRSWVSNIFMAKCHVHYCGMHHRLYVE